MLILGYILTGIGLLISVVGGIWLLIEAFKTSILWGIGCLVFSPISLVFTIMHWDVAKKPFLISMAALVLLIPGIMIVAANAPTTGYEAPAGEVKSAE